MLAAPTRKRGARAREEQQRLLTRLKTWRDQEIARQSANRFQMALDEDFYDGMQWDLSEQRALLERGQNPVVYNEVKPTVDWMIGTERRTRIDHKVTPTVRGKAAADDAVNKSKLLKYLTEVNRSEFTRSQAFDDALKAGLGWIEVGVRADPEEEPIYDRNESWRNVLYDSLGVALDLSDSRYQFRMRWLDLDIAQAYFPEGKDLLEQSAESNPDNRGIDWWFGRRLSELDPDETAFMGSRFEQFDAGAWMHNSRDRVQCYEGWWYAPSNETTGSGSQVYDRVRMRMRCTVFTDFGILWDDWSPYRHNRFPLIPVWCYRRKRDGAPYGAIRNIRGPQESLNKRMSKSLHVLSTNKVHFEADAIDDQLMDEDEIREEIASPDAFVKWASGALSGKKVLFQNDRELAQGHLALADRDRMAIREVGGVTSESLGRDTNLVSGVALRQKADQGSVVTAQPFDNLRLARQIEGEIKLSLIEQYYTEPKVFRITGDRNKHDFVSINERDPDTGEVLNDVTAMKASFVIDEQDYRESLMQAIFEQLMDMLGKIAAIDPAFARNTIDIVMEYAPVPYKDALIKRIREITGQTDPDEEMTPEKQAEKQQAKEAERAANAMTVEALRAKIADLEAATGLKKAQSARAAAEIEKLDADKITRLLEGIYAAMQAGQVVAQVPASAPVGDELLRSVGFKDQAGTGAGIVPPDDEPTAPTVPVGPRDPLPPDQQTGRMAGIETPAGEDNLR
ncbi:MAG: hypothetical protein J0H00_10850 [Burkholderiales bacterium]|nr:hypothetical protein [Burkholderiales bacterium]